MPDPERTSGEVSVLICLECGKEYMFEEEPPPEDLRCEKCGNSVFRPYVVAARSDDAEDDFRAATERDTSPEEGPGDVKPGDVRDINRL
jgi:DNA-directed RNA polymerase subunit RPC12/RpoP